MKKLFAIFAVVAMSATVFAAGGKDDKAGGKSAEEVRKEMDKKAEGAKGLREGMSSEALNKGREAALNAFTNGDTRISISGADLTKSVNNVAEAIAQGRLKSETLNELSKTGRSGIDLEIAQAAVDFIATAGLKDQLEANSVNTIDSKKETRSMLSYIEVEIVKAVNDANYKGDKTKVLNFLRTAKQELDNGKNLTDSLKKAVSDLGKSWDDFVKLCLRA